MKRMKINLDRPPVDSKSIQAHKDFSGLMKNHAMMAKPFYKSSWFFGTTGLATVGLVVGAVVVMQESPEPIPDQVITQSEPSPPDLEVSSSNIIALNAETPNPNLDDEQNGQTVLFTDYDQNKIHDKTSTLEITSEQKELNEDLLPKEDLDKVDKEDLIIDEDQILVDTKKSEVVDLMPRIGGKVNGNISRNELFDNKGITTESDVSVIHFELHLIDGLGGKVFKEEGNHLSAEMKAALKKINSGETIYFENIKGKTNKGDVVRLNPLRYVLMN